MSQWETNGPAEKDRFNGQYACESMSDLTRSQENTNFKKWDTKSDGLDWKIV